MSGDKRTYVMVKKTDSRALTFSHYLYPTYDKETNWLAHFSQNHKQNTWLCLIPFQSHSTTRVA
jgi:hypothetical protein